MKEIINRLKQYEGCIRESRGASGGIATLWNHSIWKHTTDTISQYWIKVTLENLADSKRIDIYNIYAPSHYREKEQCWTSLKADIDEEENNNIILGGDFNLILHSNEKRGGYFLYDPCKTWLETIMHDHDLVDIAPKNCRFTWNNWRLGKDNIMEWLDRILVNVSLLSSYSTAYASVLPYSTFDHYPTTLVLEAHCPLGPIPFKYSPLWSSIPIIDQIVKSTWSHHIEGSPRYIWENKLKRTKNALKDWAKNYYKEPEKATVGKIRNNVTSITNVEGNLQTTQDAIKKAASEHYSVLLTETKEAKDYSNLLQHLYTKINEDINENPTKEIEEDEIKRAIWTLQPDKAPGPHGFPVFFYKTYWGIIKKDLAKMIKWAQCKCKIRGFTNATHLALLPKENRTSSFSRFRPISLCNSSYKILTNILASRLKPLLPSLIYENQGGFLANRQSSDSILLVQEVIHSSQTRKEKGFILKLDLVNAFD
eukprot:PITA_13871